MSDRRHDLDEVEVVYEVRVWSEDPAGEAHWRTLALTVEHDDARAVGAALVTAPDSPHRHVEVWGPGRDAASHRTCVDRFPAPSREERQQMWLEAAEETFAEGYSDTRH